MDQINISAKVLGQAALEDFCPRCFWIILKVANKLPWQIFPGIFSSIDAYTKKCVHALIEKGPDNPSWLDAMGEIVAWHKAPHFSKFKTTIPEYGITLTGVADDIFELVDGSFVIPDYKTAKYTETQDKLLPMYSIQLNGYKVIAEAGDFKNVSGLWIVYFQPETEEVFAKGMTGSNGFPMTFTAKPVQIKIDREGFDAALKRTREIYDMQKIPDGTTGCKDCENLQRILDIV